MEDAPEKKRKLSDRWNQLDLKKSSIKNRCEIYASHTLPWLFPLTDTTSMEMQQEVESIGARAVNHLANKLITTLFPDNFFRLVIDDETMKKLKDAAEGGDEDAHIVLTRLDKELATAERKALKKLDFNSYRTEAVTASKHLIVTGNVLLDHSGIKEGKRVQVYGLKTYCQVRDLSGTVIELIMKDSKSFASLPKSVRDALLNQKGAKKQYKPGTNVDLYTHVELRDDGKYHMTQAADDVDLDSYGVWTKEDMPYIALTWNLVRGEDNGRGLVEDFAGSFHALSVLSKAMVNLVGIAADIKFFVDPQSLINVEEVNNSPSGTYHAGRADEISTRELGKFGDISLVRDLIDRYTRQIAQAFLLNSAMTRDAERVTAEEIRQTMQELELSHGGVYSRYSDEWQLRAAVLACAAADVTLSGGPEKKLYPVIITGMDGLSRQGELDALRQWAQDMAILNELPEAVLAAMNIPGYMAYCGVRRTVEYEKFTKSPSQVAQDNAAMAEQTAAMQDQEVGGQIAVEATKAGMRAE